MADIFAKLHPKQYQIILSADTMFDLIMILRQYNDEFEYYQAEEILTTLKEAYAGELPQDKEEDGDGTDSGMGPGTPRTDTRGEAGAQPVRPDPFEGDGPPERVG